MLAPSCPQSNQPDEINLETSQTPEISQQHDYSAKSLVYTAHAILIVVTLGLINWLSSTSSISPNTEFKFSQYFHRTLISSSW